MPSPTVTCQGGTAPQTSLIASGDAVPSQLTSLWVSISLPRLRARAVEAMSRPTTVLPSEVGLPSASRPEARGRRWT